MAIKKSELYSTLWKCCDELRGGMDASQYKDYVLAILFIKYISDKKRSDQNFLIDIPANCYFDDFIALKGKDNIGEEMNIKIAKLSEANSLDGVFTADFDDDAKLGKGKDKVETLTNLIAVFQNDNLDFSKNRAADDDLIGDAYEYLMKNFATESGKSKGQFYTPAEVSRVMAKLIGLNKAGKETCITIYDPTCGSGSLLLRAINEKPGDATVYGQEKDNATVGLAKMNMILHNEVFADIQLGDTINNPLFKIEDNKLKTFDYIVANPPFSLKSWLKSAKEEDEYHRWNSNIGIPPTTKGDYAFLLHIVRSLKQTGCGACILPHGVLFRGKSEAQIRKYLVSKKRYIKGIIGLPANLFFGTGIPACIIVVEKLEAATRKGIFMIDAKNGFIKDGSKNRLREQDIRRIVDVWEKQCDVPHYARFVPMEEIEQNDYNLNIPRYISAKDTEVLQDIDAHLNGGIPQHDIDQMENYWAACPTLKESLFCDYPDRDGYYKLKCKQDDVRDTIANNIDFIKQGEAFKKSFAEWCKQNIQELKNITMGFAPKMLIENLGNSILNIFGNNKSFIDGYDVYDCLMNYWADVMQDDCYMISATDWAVQLYTPQPTPKKKGEKTKEKKAETSEDVVCDLLPVSIVIKEYFATEQESINKLEELLSENEAKLLELTEEHAEEYLNEDNFEDSKINDTNIKKRIKSLSKNTDAEEIKVLTNYLEIKKIISQNKKDIKALKVQLLALLVDKYSKLTIDEIKNLVVEKKWFATISQRLEGEMQSISHQLTSKVTTLAERYAQTLPEIDAEIADLEAKVNEYLKQMGF